MPNHTLVEYIARQSLVSANSPATTLLRPGQLDSAFQNRSLEEDVNSTLLRQIRRHANGIDLLLVDLLAERLGVFALPDGSYVTNSRELQRSGRLGDLKPSLVRFGTDRHFSLWQRAVARLARNLRDGGVFHKTLVIDAPWAELTDSGKPVASFRDMPSGRANELYRRYFQHLQSLGLQTRRMPAHLAVSADHHKWGPAPYHYVDSAYHWIRDEVDDFLHGSAKR